MRRVGICILLLSSLKVFAQTESPQTFIVPTGQSQSLEETSASSRRYTVKPSSGKTKPKETKEKEQKVNEPDYVDPIQLRPSTPEPTPSTQVQNPTIPSETDEESERPTFIDVQVAPGIAFVDSESNYWYRDYQSSAPAVMLNASMWVSGYFGFKCGFISTFGADITAGPTDQSRINIGQQWFNYGIQFRNWKTESKLSTELHYGVRYSEFQMQAPLDSANRPRLKTTGVSAFIHARFPHKKDVSSFVEFELTPKANHKEIPTVLTLKSGDKVETSQVGLKFGRSYSLMDGNNIFWSLNSSFEKNIFKGTAVPNDPATNQTVNGVSVNNRTVMFFVGYQWSD